MAGVGRRRPLDHGHRKSRSAQSCRLPGRRHGHRFGRDDQDISRRVRRQQGRQVGRRRRSLGVRSRWSSPRSAQRQSRRIVRTRRLCVVRSPRGAPRCHRDPLGSRRSADRLVDGRGCRIQPVRPGRRRGWAAGHPQPPAGGAARVSSPAGSGTSSPSAIDGGPGCGAQQHLRRRCAVRRARTGTPSTPKNRSYHRPCDCVEGLGSIDAHGRRTRRRHPPFCCHRRRDLRNRPGRIIRVDRARRCRCRRSLHRRHADQQRSSGTGGRPGRGSLPDPRPLAAGHGRRRDRLEGCQGPEPGRRRGRSGCLLAVRWPAASRWLARPSLP